MNSDWLVVQKQGGHLNCVVPVLLTLPVAGIKYADRNNIRDEGFILAPS